MRMSIIVAGMVGISLAFGASISHADSDSDSRAESLANELALVKAENEHLRTLIPSQSHAMMDVSYHFTNLWFAGQHDNWPLAQFYFNEARNHIKWAIRLVPVRKTKNGEIKLQEIFEPIEKTLFAELQKQITAKNRKAFANAYREALAGCNGCHSAADKPYLHVVVPNQPENHIVDFKPLDKAQ